MAKNKTETKPIELVGMVDVLGTDKTAYMKTGKVYTVTAELAKTLLKKGAELK